MIFPVVMNHCPIPFQQSNIKIKPCIIFQVKCRLFTTFLNQTLDYFKSPLRMVLYIAQIIMLHSLSHFDTSEIKSSIFFFSNARISSSVGGGGTFFWFSSFFLISGPRLRRLGESLMTVMPPKESPSRMMGSLELKARLVSLGFLTGFLSARLLCFSMLRSQTQMRSRVAQAKTVEEQGAHMASTTIMPMSNSITWACGQVASQMRTVQSAEAEMKVVGWQWFHFTLYTASRWPLQVSWYCPEQASEHLWILPSSVPTRKEKLSKRLKSKQRPHARPMKEVSSSFSPVSFSLNTYSGSSLFFIRLQFITLPSEEMEQKLNFSSMSGFQRICQTGSVCFWVRTVDSQMGLLCLFLTSQTSTVPSQRPAASRAGEEGCQSRHMTPVGRLSYLYSGKVTFLSDQTRICPAFCLAKSQLPSEMAKRSLYLGFQTIEVTCFFFFSQLRRQIGSSSPSGPCAYSPSCQQYLQSLYFLSSSFWRIILSMIFMHRLKEVEYLPDSAFRSRFSPPDFSSSLPSFLNSSMQESQIYHWVTSPRRLSVMGGQVAAPRSLMEGQIVWTSRLLQSNLFRMACLMASTFLPDPGSSCSACRLTCSNLVLRAYSISSWILYSLEPVWTQSPSRPKCMTSWSTASFSLFFRSRQSYMVRLSSACGLDTTRVRVTVKFSSAADSLAYSGTFFITYDLPGPHRLLPHLPHSRPHGLLLASWILSSESVGGYVGDGVLGTYCFLESWPGRSHDQISCINQIKSNNLFPFPHLNYCLLELMFFPSSPITQNIINSK